MYGFEWVVVLNGWLLTELTLYISECTIHRARIETMHVWYSQITRNKRSIHSDVYWVLYKAKSWCILNLAMAMPWQDLFWQDSKINYNQAMWDIAWLSQLWNSFRINLRFANSLCQQPYLKCRCTTTSKFISKIYSRCHFSMRFYTFLTTTAWRTVELRDCTPPCMN